MGQDEAHAPQPLPRLRHTRQHLLCHVDGALCWVQCHASRVCQAVKRDWAEDARVRFASHDKTAPRGRMKRGLPVCTTIGEEELPTAVKAQGSRAFERVAFVVTDDYLES